MEKKRYEIQIADVDLAILSDEREDFVMSAVRQLDSRIRDLTVSNKRCSKIDAALLCSLDYFSDKLKAEKRVRNLEAQIALYDANMRRMREENMRLKAMLGENEETAEAEAEEAPAEAEAETKADAEAETAAAPAADSAAEDAPDNDNRQIKLRQIENLLRK